MTPNKHPEDKLIIALDLPSLSEAQRMTEILQDGVRFFKVGLQLFTSAGPAIIHYLKSKGFRVFLDLKFHDIPNTVSMAGIEATKHGVDMFTLHTEGGFEMMKKCRDQCYEMAHKEGLTLPKMVGVTVLTSEDSDFFHNGKGEKTPLSTKIFQLTEKASKAGLDGIVTSPIDLQSLRKKFPIPFVMVVPGIRPAGSDPNDQKRFATPSQAFQWGADYIVIGRPILQSADPRDALQKVLREMST